MSDQKTQARYDDRAVARAGVMIAVLSVVARLSAFVREAVIASTFGRSPEVDAFFLALAVPVFLSSVVAGSFQIAIVAVFLEERQKQGQEQALKLFRSGTLMMLAIFAPMTVLMALAAPYYLQAFATGFSEETLRLTADMLWIMTLFALFGGCVTTFGGLLSADKRFALPAIAPLLTPVVMTLMLLLFSNQLGVGALAWGAVIGTGLEAVIVGFACRHALAFEFPRFDKLAMFGLLRRWAPLVLSTLLLSGAALIDQMMAASLGSGSASAIGYGVKLVLAGLGIVTLALGMSVLPAYSEEAGIGDQRAFLARLNRHIMFMFATSIPVLAITSILAEPVISLMYERGAFTAEDTALVSSILIAYVMQLPFFAATVILVRAAAVLGLGRGIAGAAFINIVMTIGLNALFMEFWGVVGIAIATAPAFLATAGALYMVVMRRLLSPPPSAKA